MATLLERRIDAIFKLLSDHDPERGVGTDEIALALAHEAGVDPTNPLCWQVLMAAVAYESEHLREDDSVKRQMNIPTFATLIKQTQPAL